MSKNILGKMDIGDTVSFDLHVSSVLPQDYSLVKIELTCMRYMHKFIV